MLYFKTTVFAFIIGYVHSSEIAFNNCIFKDIHINATDSEFNDSSSRTTSVPDMTRQEVQGSVRTLVAWRPFIAQGLWSRIVLLNVYYNLFIEIENLGKSVHLRLWHHIYLIMP